MNHSMICLIPKQHAPENLSQFRPICLSNVVIKIITKVIANQMKPLMGDLISMNQASFIPGRDTTNNILMVQEMIHTLRRKKGKKGNLVAKIDLEKAYDKVDWDFLRQVLEIIRVGPTIRTMIMSCITSTNLWCYGMGRGWKASHQKEAFVKGIHYHLIFSSFAWRFLATLLMRRSKWESGRRLELPGTPQKFHISSLRMI